MIGDHPPGDLPDDVREAIAGLIAIEIVRNPTLLDSNAPWVESVLKLALLDSDGRPIDQSQDRVLWAIGISSNQLMPGPGDTPGRWLAWQRTTGDAYGRVLQIVGKSAFDRAGDDLKREEQSKFAMDMMLVPDIGPLVKGVGVGTEYLISQASDRIAHEVIKWEVGGHPPDRINEALKQADDEKVFLLAKFRSTATFHFLAAHPELLPRELRDKPPDDPAYQDFVQRVATEDVDPVQAINGFILELNGAQSRMLDVGFPRP